MVACVATGDERELCDAAHLIAASKGDDVRAIHSTPAAHSVYHVLRQYIRILTDKSIHEPVSMDAINDTRNGLFLHKLIHFNLEKSIGILPVCTRL
jgi:hypothetical protein